MILICIMGKSGSGKSEIEKQLEKLGFNRIISYTTRDMREGEVNGVHYHFVNDEQFEKLIERGILMEHAQYAGKKYGSPRPVGSINNVVVVETEGYRQIKKLYGRQVIGVYVDVDTEISRDSALHRLSHPTDADIKEIEGRVKEDTSLFSSIGDAVDVIVDDSKPIEVSVAEILKFVSNLKKGRKM